MVREVRALDGNLALYEMITLQEQVDRSTSPQQVAVTLVAFLGGLSLLLAAIGLYGVMSYAVSQSTRELGLRMALGAGASNLLRLVISRGFVLTAGGVFLGAAVALGLTRLLGTLLFKVSPRDPLAFGSALVVMTLVALAACLFPAWRATRTDRAMTRYKGAESRGLTGRVGRLLSWRRAQRRPQEPKAGIHPSLESHSSDRCRTWNPT